MKTVKIIIVIVLMIVLWFSKDFFWYTNFKSFYDSEIAGKIMDIRQARGGKQFKIKNNNYVSLFAENDEDIKVGDSISKKNKSVEIKVFKIENKKWRYSKSIFVKKDLDFYTLIVDQK